MNCFINFVAILCLSVWHLSAKVMGLFGASKDYFLVLHSLTGRRLLEQVSIYCAIPSGYYCYFLFESGRLVLEYEGVLGRWFSFGLVVE